VGGGVIGEIIPNFWGGGIKYLISPNIFTVQKIIFNAFSVLDCFNKKLQQIWGDFESLRNLDKSGLETIFLDDKRTSASQFNDQLTIQKQA
jgi:hypothetical protein